MRGEFMIYRKVSLGLAGWILGGLCLFARAAEPEVLERVFVDEVWAGHRVGFCLLTAPPFQFVGYYNAEREMVIARRRLGTQEWERKVLPERVGWDSHNYITMALDRGGCLHISGNMHSGPLVYFRGSAPLEISGLERVPSMVGDRETRCTYPVFLRGPGDELIFMYRDGGSGNGDQVFNGYDEADGVWRRMLDTPLTSGEGAMNAYFHGPVRGPDGYYHLCWVWRDTPDCETNHDICYARSRDFASWEDSAGRKLTLPITLKTAEIVDPVPAGGGVINGNAKLGFDAEGRVMITYHKYDTAGNTQVFVARREGDGWRRYQVSAWDTRWEFSGRGSIPFLVHVQGAKPVSDDKVEIGYSHWEKGSGVWVLDGETLALVGSRPPDRRYPRLSREESVPGLQPNWAGDLGGDDADGSSGVRYQLYWATRGVNRDRPQGEPTTSRLEVVGSGLRPEA
ncbi:MAG TPA: hypothetical protein DEW46_04715 [Verrucomicrobia bacterium]|jgi:hypothetical protein|nr:hypothetical protein [Verrucomicrobiota bacterium]